MMQRGNPSRIATNDVAGLDIKAGMVVWQSHKYSFTTVPALADDVIPVRGIALNDAAPGQGVQVVIEGRVVFDDPIFTPGQVYAVSDVQPGAIIPHSELQEGAFVHVLGVAVDVYTLDLNLRPLTVQLEKPVQRVTAPAPKPKIPRSSSMLKSDALEDDDA